MSPRCDNRSLRNLLATLRRNGPVLEIPTKIVIALGQESDDDYNMKIDPRIKIGVAFAAGGLAIGGWAFAAAPSNQPDLKHEPAAELVTTTSTTAPEAVVEAPVVTTTVAPAVPTTQDGTIDKRVGALETRVSVIEATTTTSEAPFVTALPPTTVSR